MLIEKKTMTKIDVLFFCISNIQDKIIGLHCCSKQKTKTEFFDLVKSKSCSGIFMLYFHSYKQRLLFTQKIRFHSKEETA